MSELQDYMDEIRMLIHDAMLTLDYDEYEQFAEYTDECLAGQE